MICKRCGSKPPDGSLFCNVCGKRLSKKDVKVITPHRQMGTGCIRERKDGKRNKPFEARIGGKFIGNFTTRAEAVTAMDKFIADNRPRDYAGITFSGLYDLWKPEHDKTVSKTAISAMDSAYRKAASLHKRKFAELKAADYQDIINQLESTGASLSLVQKQKQLFTSLCAYAMKQDIIDKNYAAFCKITAKEKNPDVHDRIFTDEEINLFEAYIGHRKYGRIARILMVLIYTGMRITELLIMRREDVDLEKRIMTGGIKTDAGRNRSIPIHSRILPIIEEWMTTDTTSPFLIANSKSSAPLDAHNVGRDFRAFMQECGIQGATIHNTRHTCSTRLLAAGVNPEVVKTILGHASIKTTVDIYTHPDDAALLSGIESI